MTPFLARSRQRPARMGMANQGQQELLPNHPLHADVQAGQQQRQQHLLDAARVLMLLGAAAAVVSTSAVCNCNPDNADDATWVWVFLGFVTWLLGVCLLLSVPLLAGQFFPQADRFAGAAIAIAGAVLRRFLVPWN